MKLVIRETCVVQGGEVKERGQLYTTNAQDPKTDQEAFALISANRAYKIGTPEATALLEEVSKETAAKAEAAKTPPAPPKK